MRVALKCLFAVIGGAEDLLSFKENAIKNKPTERLLKNLKRSNPMGAL